MLKRTKSKHDGNVYCLNCHYSYRTENKLKKHENICANYDYCYVEMPKKAIKYQNTTMAKNLWKFNLLFMMIWTLYLKKWVLVIIILKKPPTTKINKHTPSAYSFFTHCLFNATKISLTVDWSKDCMERFCKDLRKHAVKIISYEKKMIPITVKESKSYDKLKICYMYKRI